MLTRAELAFSFLDPEKTGYITRRQLRMISKKLSKEEVKALMIKVKRKSTPVIFMSNFFLLQLDKDQDGKLSLEEFKVLFHRNERRRRSEAPKQVI